MILLYDNRHPMRLTLKSIHQTALLEELASLLTHRTVPDVTIVECFLLNER